MLADQPQMQAYGLKLSGIFSHSGTYKAVLSQHCVFDQFLEVVSSAHKYVNCYFFP